MELGPGKAESRGRERPSCSWAAPAAALRKGQLVTKQKPPMLIPQDANHAENDSGGLLCCGEGAPWHISAELGGGEA